MTERQSELIAAFIDGTLKEDECAELLREVKGDAELARQLEQDFNDHCLLRAATEKRSAGQDQIDINVSIYYVKASTQNTAMFKRVQNRVRSRANGLQKAIPSRRLYWFISFAAMIALALLAYFFAFEPAQPRQSAEISATGIKIIASVPGVTIHRGIETLTPTAGTALESGDSLHVPAQHGATDNASVVAAYSDGTRLEIAATSILQLKSAGTNSKSKELALLTGSLICDAVKQPAGAPFILTTKEAKVTVVGTRFTLSADPGKTQLHVSEGRVNLDDKVTHQSVQVGAEEMTVADNRQNLFITQEPSFSSNDHKPLIWNFEKGPPADFKILANSWNWQKTSETTGRMTVAPKSTVVVNFPVVIPARPMLIKIRATNINKGNADIGGVWMDGNTVTPYVNYTNPLHFSSSGEKRLDYNIYIIDRFLVGFFVEYNQIGLICDYSKPYPSTNMCLYFMNVNIESIEVEALKPDEIPKSWNDLSQVIKDLKLKPYVVEAGRTVDDLGARNGEQNPGK